MILQQGHEVNQEDPMLWIEIHSHHAGGKLRRGDEEIRQRPNAVDRDSLTPCVGAERVARKDAVYRD